MAAVAPDRLQPAGSDETQTLLPDETQTVVLGSIPPGGHDAAQTAVLGERAPTAFGETQTAAFGETPPGVHDETQPGAPGASQASVAVVGAGWAGLAAALSLAEAGVAVTLFDSAPVAGGRARTTSLDTPLGRFELDNGQHLIVGAYRATLALIDRLGASTALRRERLEISSPSGMSLRVARLPAPLHVGWALLRARGLRVADRLAMLRLMQGLQRSRWRTRPGETVEAMLQRWRQPPRLIERLWAPLCIGALNTLPEHACGQSFAVVLRDTLGADRPASDFITGERPLGTLLPEPALVRLQQLGAEIRLRATVRALRRTACGWEVATNRTGGRSKQAAGPGGATGGCAGGAPGLRGSAPRYTAVLLALPPWSAARLLAPLGLDVSPLQAFEPEPIATAWAFWPADAAPALPRWSLLDEDGARAHHGQWLFDRGIVMPTSPPDRARALPPTGRRLPQSPSSGDGPHATGNEPAGIGRGFTGPPPAARVAGIVISVASRLDPLGPRAVENGIASQLLDAFGAPAPTAVRLVSERRATFRCTPDRPRLGPDRFSSEVPGLWLAGDWLWPDYPATLEAAVRSGHQAAQGIIANMEAERAPS